MASIEISLPDTLLDYVNQEVAAGNYSSASDYLIQLVREDRKRRARRRLAELLQECIDSGPCVAVTPELWAELRREVAEFAARREG